MVVVESPELVGCSEAEPGGATAMRGNGLKDDYTFVSMASRPFTEPRSTLLLEKGHLQFAYSWLYVCVFVADLT